MNIRFVQVLLISLLIGFTQVHQAYAQIPDTSDVPSGSELNGDTGRVSKKIYFRPTNYESNNTRHYLGSFGTTQPDSSYEGKMLRDLTFSGLFRFIGIYRDMQKYYPDMQTSPRNISFLDYPLAGLGEVGGVGNPMLALAMTGRVGRNVDFRVSYSLSHLYTGNPANQYNKFMLSNGGLVFEGNIKTDAVALNLRFGGLMTFKVSRLVFDAPRYRNNYFDVLVSNQYSVSKFENDYAKDADHRIFLWPYVKGGIARATFSKLNNTQLLLMYGRTGNSAVGVNTIEDFPAINYLIRVSTPFRYGPLNGVIAGNVYVKDADTDPVHNIKDDVHLYSGDLVLKMQNMFELKADIGYSLIQNPLITDAKFGSAYIFSITPDKRFKLPVYLEYYNIGYNYGNLDGAVLNSNTALRSGGVYSPRNSDQTLFINVAQEVGMTANNRSGINAGVNLKVGELRIELAYAVSQEKSNVHDSITFQHRVNAFSRSRFWQWRQGIGPYSRINGAFARTYELITITDEANGISTDYRKGFNNLELMLRYKFNVFGRALMLFNFNNFVSIQDHLAFAPVISDKAFIRTFYEDFTLIYKITKRVALIGNFGVERVWGNDRVDLSPDKITDGSGNPYSNKERRIDQTGTAVGFGFGYDITTKMSINYRQKWMYHKDNNFALDQFKGQEYTMEFKMFF